MPRLLLLLLAGSIAVPAAAAPRAITVPADVGVGPTSLHWFGPVFDDWPWHVGLTFSVAAVITPEWVRENKRRIPKKYRRLAETMGTVRIGPSIFLPDTLILSPPIGSTTGMWGASWRPLSLGAPLFDGNTLQVRASVGARLTALYLHSQELPDTFFLRPGLDAQLTVEIALSDEWLVSLGWTQAAYVPQALGRFDLGTDPSQWMWASGQGWLKLHYRFPYTLYY